MNKQILCILGAAVLLTACENQGVPVSAAGVRQATASITTNANGRSVEQENILERVERDNRVGSIKHLYVISAYSGQTIIYSTVRGKVTSSGKRLTPTTVNGNMSSLDNCTAGIGFRVNDQYYCTEEMVQDDGTYGTSIPYLYWYDSRGVYHQHYPEGGQIIHISDQPMSVPRIILNLETQTVAEAEAPAAAR